MGIRIDRFAVLKSAVIAVILTIDGMALQVLKGLFLLKKDPPNIAFIAEVTGLYLITGFLFGLGYFMVKDAVPGRNRVIKGLVYALLVFFGVCFGNFIGMIGLDFAGGNDLGTAYKVEAYWITLVDFVNFAITGIILGVMAERRGATPARWPETGRGLVLASLCGFVGFPALAFSLYALLESFLPPALCVPDGVEAWFYVGTFLPLAITGAGIPPMYAVLRRAFAGGPARRGRSFFLYYFLCFWIVNVAFGLPFGFSLLAAAYLLASSAVPIYLLIRLSALIIEGGDARSRGLGRSSAIGG